jgi:hypothetical protein
MAGPSRTAARVERQPAVRALARVGLFAIGVLHILIGIIALSVAAGAGGGSADQTGALQTVTKAPGGLFVVWAVIVGLVFLSLWQILQAVTAHRPAEKAIEVAKCVVYAALAVIAVSVASGTSHSSSSQDKSASTKLLAVPGGVFLLAAVGIAIVVTGIVFIRNGATHRFERDLRLPPNRLAGVTTTLGRVGYIAKGVALIVVGGLVVWGAVASDPSKAGGLDSSLKELTRVPFGVVLLVLIALGLIAYGAFWCVRAFASRLSEP